MNLRLFQELTELNAAFEQVIQGLQCTEKVKLYHSAIIRYARADVESARVDANREFFDNFDEIVENDAVGPTNSNANTTRRSKTRTTSISKSRTPRSGARKRDCLRAWSSCPVGICPTKNATTRSKPKSESVSVTRGRKQRRDVNRGIRSHHDVQQTIHK